ncbi:MAG: ATP-binding protein [Solirubrobacteraceae bacterium]
MARTNAADGLDASYPADPTQVARIRRAVSAVAIYCGVDAETQDRVELAVSEAATNVVLHAYRDARTSGPIHVTASAVEDGRFLDIVVSDRGIGMSSRSDSPGLGVGLALMAHEADQLEILGGHDGGTDVRLRFALATDLWESAVA